MPVAQVITSEPLLWANLGVLGLLVWGAIRGEVWFKPAVSRLQKDLDRALADMREALVDLRRLEQLDRDVIIPALTRSTELIQRLTLEIRSDNHPRED